MISEKYKQQLLREAKQLDIELETKNEFEKLASEVVSDRNVNANLELLKKLGEIAQKFSSTKLNEKQQNISELLFTYLGALEIESTFENLKTESNISLQELMRRLDDLIGLNNVKQQVRDLIGFNQIQKLREKNHLKISNKTLHMAFLGNPGTAKTTVARIVGRMFKAIGLLSKGHFIEVTRTDLIAEYQGQTAIKVKRLVNRARGGVLFIDEAYSITENDHSDSYGKESLTELTKALEDYRNDLVVIVAGYTDLMEQFFESNPRLKSRFNTFLSFDNYSIKELVEIFEFTCEHNDYKTDTVAMKKIQDYIQIEFDKKDKHFANGRFVRNLFDDVTMNQSKRLSKIGGTISKEMLITLEIDDMPKYSSVTTPSKLKL